MSAFRMKWTGTWRDTRAVTAKGAELRVKFLPGSATWGIYVNGFLRSKTSGKDGRARAKRLATSWYGRSEPEHSVPCTQCNGTGRVRRTS